MAPFLQLRVLLVVTVVQVSFKSFESIVVEMIADINIAKKFDNVFQIFLLMKIYLKLLRIVQVVFGL